MIEKNYDLSFDDGYVVGFDEGRKVGYTEGYEQATQDTENRLAKYWAELQTLNARVDYINTQMDKKHEASSPQKPEDASYE